MTRKTLSDEHKYTALVFIGRFQIPHHGHFNVIKDGLYYTNRLIIGIGSANRPRSPRNPFTYEERVDFIANCGITEIEEAVRDGRIVFMPVDDNVYNEKAWVSQVRKGVESITGKYTTDTCLIGCSKDNSSYYLKLFPFWKSIGVEISVHATEEAQKPYNSSEIRDWWVSYARGVARNTNILSYTTEKVVNALIAYCDTEWYSNMVKELEEIHLYKTEWKKAPYPVCFNTVDNVVTCNGKILLIKRGKFPGKGMLALPGGFLNIDEDFTTGALRELAEETQIETPENVLRAWAKPPVTFAALDRDPRGRTITHATWVNLPFFDVPSVIAGDDAAEAFWADPKDIDPRQMISDHYFIIRELTGLV